MTFLHFSQLHKFAIDIYKGCIFAADTVFLVCKGACGKLLMEFPYTGWQCARSHNT